MITFNKQEAQNIFGLIDRALKHAPVGGAQDAVIITALLQKIYAVAYPAEQAAVEVEPNE